MTTNSPEISEFPQQPEMLVSPVDIVAMQQSCIGIITESRLGESYNDWVVTRQTGTGVVLQNGHESKSQHLLIDNTPKGTLFRRVAFIAGPGGNSLGEDENALIISPFEGAKTFRPPVRYDFEKDRGLDSLINAQKAEDQIDLVYNFGVSMSPGNASNVKLYLADITEGMNKLHPKGEQPLVPHPRRSGLGRLLGLKVS
jgi:hypothetical protein